MRSVITVFIFLTLLTSAQAQQGLISRDDFLSKVEQFKTDSGNAILRKEIIEASLKLDPLPSTPEEARKYLIRGKAAVKSAANEQEFLTAAREFENALKQAPWLSEAYYNLGIVLDKSGQYDQAIENLKLYLLASPNASDARQVQDLIYEIEFRKENSAQTKAAEAEQKREKMEKLIKSLKGKWIVNEQYMRSYYDASLNYDEITMKWTYSECKGDGASDCVSGVWGLKFRVDEDLSVRGTANYVSESYCTYNKWYPLSGQLTDDGSSLAASVEADGLDFRGCKWIGGIEEYTFVIQKY